MQNFVDLLKDVVINGTDKPDRTGVGSRAVFGRTLRWDLAQGFPLQTTRKVPLRIAFEETMFFLRGETQTKILEEKNINIWKGNTSREFLDKRGLNHLPVGDMGKGYGYQWRHWEYPNAEYSEIIEHVDQVAELLDGIRKDPYGRRHVVTGWNPGQLAEMALPPCHMMHMYSVEGNFEVSDGRLNNCFVMRSNDVPYGLPFNIASYALLNHIFAKHLGLVPGELVYFGWDVHIYQNQMEMVKEIVEREPRALPQLIIKKDLPTLDSIMSLQWEDIELIGYDPYPDVKNKPPMAV
jgi:thymidylate synthase